MLGCVVLELDSENYAVRCAARICKHSRVAGEAAWFVPTKYLSFLVEQEVSVGLCTLDVVRKCCVKKEMIRSDVNA